VADDITKVTLVDGREVIGTSAEVTRNHMEVRGIGIINVAAMFGVKSIRQDKRVDLVVSLKSWNEVQDVDRLAQHAPGTRTAFLDLLERLAGDARVGTIREHGERWREEFSA